MNRYLETMKNGEEFYKRSQHSYVSKMIDGGGFTSRIDTSDRAYNVIMRVEEKTEKVIMEIYPGIHCSNETRSQTAEYISKINDNYKMCNIRISSNGNIHVHTEQRIDNAPVTSEMFKRMEVDCIDILETFETVIEKFAHGRLIEPEEADIDNMIITKLRSSIMSDPHDMPAKDKDDAADEVSISEEKLSFERWMKEYNEKNGKEYF